MEGIKYIPKEVLDKLLSLSEEELHEVLEHFINKYGNHECDRC